jgi:hypothetical protein
VSADGELQQAVWAWLDDKFALEYEASEMEPLILLDVVSALRDYETRTGTRVTSKVWIGSGSTRGGQHPPLRPASSAVD